MQKGFYQLSLKSELTDLPCMSWFANLHVAEVILSEVLVIEYRLLVFGMYLLVIMIS